MTRSIYRIVGGVSAIMLAAFQAADGDWIGFGGFLLLAAHMLDGDI